MMTTMTMMKVGSLRFFMRSGFHGLLRLLSRSSACRAMIRFGLCACAWCLCLCLCAEEGGVFGLDVETGLQFASFEGHTQSVNCMQVRQTCCPDVQACAQRGWAGMCLEGVLRGRKGQV